MHRSSCLERFEISIEASMDSGIQGLDPKENFQLFIGLVRVKECIIGVSKEPKDLACLSSYGWGINFRRDLEIQK